jgi:uncharacterized protein (TIGR03435 family)
MNMNSSSRCMRIAVVAGLIGTVHAQPPTTPRTFEVASIKPNNSGLPRVQGNPLAYLPGGRFTATNATLVDVIVRVYPTRRIQMHGGPDWIDSERFDIVAKADASEGEVKDEQWAPMVQALLEDRFKLKMHRETKEMPVYALVAGKSPPKIKASKEGEPTTVAPGDGGQLNFQGMPIPGLVNTLANILHEPVVNGTSIEGRFDFTLDPMQFASTGGTSGGADSYADLVLRAVQEQLGFKLEKRKAPLEITMIDRAEKPSAN